MKSILSIFTLLLLTANANAIIIGEHGGSVFAPGNEIQPKVVSAICTYNDVTIYFAEATLGKDEAPLMTFRAVGENLQTQGSLPELKYSGYEGELLESYLWIYVNSYNDDNVTFFMEDQDTVVPGVYNVPAKLRLTTDEGELSGVAQCTDVEIKSRSVAQKSANDIQN